MSTAKTAESIQEPIIAVLPRKRRGLSLPFKPLLRVRGSFWTAIASARRKFEDLNLWHALSGWLPQYCRICGSDVETRRILAWSCSRPW